MDKYPEAEKILIERFGRDTLVSLATLDGKRPAVRIVNGYYEDGAFYTATNARSGKMRQVKRNPGVALCAEWFTAQGVGENIGHVRDAGNAALMEKLRAVFSAWYDNGDVDENDPHACILRTRLAEGVLMSHGTRYEIDFAKRKAK
ncbi:MAG: pyridoxamine 5'-phosphate oxidase family protein [Oscillospiraceae bacterium]|jgi:general stress protein 26|nr:pyridoxamine 5'-phosphate oxidase family protein [Oscillospiraceae bacterium]